MESWRRWLNKAATKHYNNVDEEGKKKNDWCRGFFRPLLDSLLRLNDNVHEFNMSKSRQRIRNFTRLANTQSIYTYLLFEIN